MAEQLSADDVKRKYLDAMGPRLGVLQYELFQECARLHSKWQEFNALYGHSEERIELLNRASAPIFWLLQETLWDHLLLHLTRLTDRTVVGRRETLTIQRLLPLVAPALRQQLAAAIDRCIDATAFARDWRNRHIAHSDFILATDEHATPLQFASRKSVIDSIAAITDTLNLVEGHYGTGPVDYRLPAHGADSLVRVLKYGVAERERRLGR
jgi:hypothetical protein